MLLSELEEYIATMKTRHPLQFERDLEVVIPVWRMGADGPHPCVEVKNIHVGFDWDNGRLFITPPTALREIDRDEIDTLQKKYSEVTWKKHQIDDLKRVNKKLRDEIDRLRKEKQ